MNLSAIKPYKFEFEHLKKEPGIVHGIFARTGGVSKPPFDSLNVGMNCGDAKSDVISNRKLLKSLSGNKAFVVFLDQVHKDNIKLIKEDDTAKLSYEKSSFTADAVITDIKDTALVIQVADCQAVMLYDTQNKVIANIHSGWRGSLLNIIGKTVDKMLLEFKCQPENILAGISPSLGPCCAEFINFRREIPEHLWKYKIKNTNYFDFWAMSQDQLMEKGLLKENIQNMKICTKCNTNTFYSYRGEKLTGRFGCVIALR